MPKNYYNLPKRKHSRHQKECGVGTSTTRGGSLQNLHALGMEGTSRGGGNTWYLNTNGKCTACFDYSLQCIPSSVELLSGESLTLCWLLPYPAPQSLSLAIRGNPIQFHPKHLNTMVDCVKSLWKIIQTFLSLVYNFAPNSWNLNYSTTCRIRTNVATSRSGYAKIRLS